MRSPVSASMICDIRGFPLSPRRGTLGPGRFRSHLELRALKDNGDFEEYWRHHLAREHERLYPTPDRHDHRLTA